MCFDSARHFTAWLELTPRSHSSGSKERLGRTSMGNPEVRSGRCRGDSRLAGCPKRTLGGAAEATSRQTPRQDCRRHADQ
ncbi:IS110 family transposase [Bradyrhizobium sp. NC92]|uniref:IS110 family transposase n=1 Tax=Bradyrhizobium sp. (strain NC92) TaxID=55395 RepID=UPI0021A97C17|nr:IS110 family transposase [Bradyrhizobium sp. NC92]UWU67804.1 IS110 family transposase [Bradyrhizobium sp. NC92]